MSSPFKYNSHFHPSFHKKNYEISISNQTKLDEQIKMNSRATTRFNADLSFARPWHPFSGFSLMDPKNESTAKDKTVKRLKKMAYILQQEKYISSLIYKIKPKTPSEMALAISKLKHLKIVTSIDLEILSLNLCTPSFIKSLSITLSHLKDLTSLRISFPMSIQMTPQLLKSLFFGLKRLKYLTSLSLAAEYSKSFDNESLIALSSCVSRLTQLKSFTVTFEKCYFISNSALNTFAPIFKKLAFLQNLNINFRETNTVHFQSIINFFTSLNDLKSLKSLALNLQGCSLGPTFTDSVSASLSMLNASLLESLHLKYHSISNEANLSELGMALQRFPSLRNLSLDFAKNFRISDEQLSQLASSLQTLHELTSLNMNLSSTRLTNCVGVLGGTIKPLVKLKSLNLDFSQQKVIDDVQLSSLSGGLQGLTALKNLNLKFSDSQVTDKGFAAFFNALKGLTELSTLQIELWNMKELTNKTMRSLSSAIGNLTKLTDLSFHLIGNSLFNKKDMNNLGRALEKLVWLTSISLYVANCDSLEGDEDNFLAIFKALGQLKHLRKITASLPYDPVNLTTSQIYTRHVPDQIIFQS